MEQGLHLIWQNFINGKSPQHVYVQDVGPAASWTQDPLVYRKLSAEGAAGSKEKKSKATSARTPDNKRKSKLPENSDKKVERDVAISGNFVKEREHHQRPSQMPEEATAASTASEPVVAPTSTVPGFSSSLEGSTVVKQLSCKKCKCARKRNPYSALDNAVSKEEMCQKPVCASK
jgi:hypothetical protein